MKTTYGRLCEEERVVVARLEMADNAWKQTVGLIGRKNLAEDSGLWFAHCNAIHTFGMRFPLDVVFLDRHGVAVRLVPNVRPWRVRGVWGARTVIELPAGTIARRQLEHGRRYTVVNESSGPGFS